MSNAKIVFNSDGGSPYSIQIRRKLKFKRELNYLKQIIFKQYSVQIACNLRDNTHVVTRRELCVVLIFSKDSGSSRDSTRIYLVVN
jgi:hypothetical protein